MKKIFKFILIFVPWLLSGFLFSKYTNFYNELNLPFFSLPKPLFSIFWFIIYFLISISIYKIYDKYNICKTKNYNFTLLINYISNQLYLFFFFYLQNTFLGLVDSVVIFITTLLLYHETYNLDYKSSVYLKPYIYYDLYAVILSLTIYFMNL